MPRCGKCGYAHALPTHCGNCGSENPLYVRKIIKWVVIALIISVASVFFYYFADKAHELHVAEQKAATIGHPAEQAEDFLILGSQVKIEKAKATTTAGGSLLQGATASIYSPKEHFSNEPAGLVMPGVDPIGSDFSNTDAPAKVGGMPIQ